MDKDSFSFVVYIIHACAHKWNMMPSLVYQKLQSAGCSDMIVYHGSTESVRNPDINHSYRALDFDMGFYVTTVKEQASYDQIAFITQRAIDELLVWESCEEI